ncbi:MAG: CoA transferase [Alphaproteobacteria bacterium]|nr:CoA transferase [Alphaproteobacteria bacterium]
MAVAPETAGGPLAGILVLDLTRVLAGPFAAMQLLDLGARVVKIERPGTGDDARHIGPFVDGASVYFASVNRGKESIALDLKDPRDLALFERLLAKADVLLENYRGGTMEKLGLGWDVLARRHPRLVYAAVSGFGHSGPYAQKPAYDMVVQAMGGIMSLTGHPGGPATRVGTSIGDLAAGLFCATGILAALYDRKSTGRGQKVDVSMLDCQVAFLENAIARYFATGTVPGPLGSRHPSIAPFAAFRAGDGALVIAAGNDELFRRLTEILALPEAAADPRFVSNASRTEHAEALAEILERALARGTVADWLARLEAAGIPCGPINSVADVVADPQVRARNMIVTADGGPLGPFPVAGNPMKLSAHADPATRGRVPALDADRARILAELGISGE